MFKDWYYSSNTPFISFNISITTYLCKVKFYLQVSQSNSFNGNDLILFNWGWSCLINKPSLIRSLSFFASKARISNWWKSIEQSHLSDDQMWSAPLRLEIRNKSEQRLEICWRTTKISSRKMRLLHYALCVQDVSLINAASACFTGKINCKKLTWFVWPANVSVYVTWTVFVYSYTATHNINSPEKLINIVKENRNPYT